MKKVLILTTIGGFLSQFELNDVKLLIEMGYQIHYASNFQNPIYEVREEELKAMGVILHHISIEKSPLKIKRNLKALLELKKIVREENITLIHCHNPMGGVIGRLCSINKEKKSIPVIYTAHGLHFYHGAPILNWLLYYPVERFLARFTDIIVTINKEDYKRVKGFPLRKNGKIFQIPGVGIDTNKFKEKIGYREQIRKQLNIPQDAFFVLSVGELNHNKNHKVILKACAQLEFPHIHYGICGRGKQKDALLDLAEKLGMSERFHLFGFRKDIPEVLQAADCFAFPSKREGLGIAAIEAMAGGIPLITSDCRGTREYLKSGMNGFSCSSQNPLEYSLGIGKLMMKREVKSNMSRNCLDMAEQFHIRETEKIMRQVYQSVESNNNR